MRTLILGTAGHIDHGKTTLVRALTGTETDRLAEEKRRGITIDLGFADLRLGTGDEELRLGIVDVPGHEGFIRNMLAGATGMDLVLLVVAADEGVMPQTREHLAIVELLGVRGGVVAITKSDLVEPEWLDLVVEDVRSELAVTPFAGAPVVPVSASRGDGLDALRDALYHAAVGVGQRSDEDLFRLPVDRVFTVRGTGTVVTGTVWSGRAARDQTVRILPAGDSARVRALQVHGVDTDAGRAGQRAAFALAGIERARLARGAVLVTDGAWEAHGMITARLSLLPDAARPLRSRQRARFHLGTAEVMGRVVLLDGRELAPGDRGWGQLRLESPVVARAGDRFVLRSYSPMTTIGGGTVAEPLANKRRRLRPEERARLELLLTGTDAEVLLARVRVDDWTGVVRARLAIETPLSPAAVAAAIRQLQENAAIVVIGDRVFAADTTLAARELLLSAADDYHRENPLQPGIDREELRRALPDRAPPELVEWTLAGLLDDGALEANGRWVIRKGFSPRLSPEQENARERLVELFTRAGLTPPSLSDLPPELRDRQDFRPILEMLERDGRLVALAPELYLARSSIDAAISTVRRDFAGRDELNPSDFKDLFPISRKFLIPLLEYLDRAGVTIRRGDARVLASD